MICGFKYEIRAPGEEGFDHSTVSEQGRDNNMEEGRFLERGLGRLEQAQEEKKRLRR